MARTSLALALIVIAAGCGPAGTTAQLPRTALQATAPPGPRLLLVTIDGARARDVFGGADPALAAARGLPAAAGGRDGRALMPNLHRLIERGVALGGPGAPMLASGPRYVSLPGYREILTGRAAAGCRDNDCPALDEPTLLDELRGAAGEVVAIASWERTERAASVSPASLWLSAGRHGGAQRQRLAVSAAARHALDAGRRAGAWPGRGDYRPDAATAALAVEVAAALRPRVLWVGLGDSDEHAHRDDYGAYLDALAAADVTLGRLVAALGLEETIVVVTADHGRSANFRDHGDSPESGEVWLVAAGGPIAPVAAGPAPAAPPRRLRDIAPTLRALLGLHADDSPRAGAVIPEIAGTAAGYASSR
jgi:hypothetical protein